MNVAVLVPRGGECPHRAAAWQWVRARYAEHHPTWDIIEGTSDPSAYSRSQAILDAFSQSDADVLVVADADVWTDNIAAAVDAASEQGWAIPHGLIHRLSRESTEAVLAGEDWVGLPLSTDNRQDSRPYLGHETGTLVVLRLDVLLEVPPDPRFVGWGQEDDAWAAALRSLVGKPWRGTADLVHLWHPPQPRMTRAIGNKASLKLAARYHRARRSPTQMRALIDEVNPWRSASSSSTTGASPRS